MDDYVIAIPLSTTEDCLNLHPSSSRFFKSGWFGNQFITCKKEIALKEYAGQYDNPRRLNEASKKLKELVNNTI